MSLTIKTTTNTDDPANFIALSISNQLKFGKTVLFFVTGGSSIYVAVKVAEYLKNQDCHNLTILLGDERYGAIGHPDSNWQQMLDKGFSLPGAKLVPILTGDDLATTTEKFNENLAYEFNIAGYTIGLFGVGADGHTMGILPDSEAVNSEDLAFGYETRTFSRITITPALIEKLDEAVVFMQGKEKWGVLEDLASPVGSRPMEKNIAIIKQPAQVLKKVRLLTIFTDYNAFGRHKINK